MLKCIGGVCFPDYIQLFLFFLFTLSRHVELTCLGRTLTHTQTHARTVTLLYCIHTVASLPPKITTVESLTERTLLTWTHNTVCFNTSDIEYVVSWVDLASGGGLNGTTMERNFTIRTGVRGVYRVRITTTVRGVSSVGGVVASWEDSGTEVLVHTGMLPLCVVCACPKIHAQNVSLLHRPTHSPRD